jgi:type IV pilus assembly protein PilQ
VFSLNLIKFSHIAQKGYMREETMTFLQLLNGFGKKAAVVLIIVSCFALSVFSQKVGQQEGKPRYGDAGFIGEPINLNIVNMDVRDILSYITEQYGVNFVIDKSVAKTPVTVNVSDVPWNIALDAILRSQDLGIQVNGPILRVADSKILANEVDIQAKIDSAKLDAAPLFTEFIRLKYAKAMGGGVGATFTSGTSASSPIAGGDGAAGDGLMPIIKRRLSRRGAIETDSRSNSLIITDVKDNIDAIRQLVAILDQPEAQVEVEARIVLATRDFSRDIGVQISGLVLGNRVGTNGSAQYDASGNLISGIANSVLRLTTGTFGTARIDALLTAGEKQGQSKTIASPRVSTINNKLATFESGQQIPVVTTQAGSGQGTPVFTTTYISVPLKLEVTPQITDDGTVLLDVVVENSSLSSTVSAGGSPGINTSRTKVNVMVPDGGTTVVGGAMVDAEGENRFGTPGLSKIPVLGNLFKRKAIARTTNEVIFFITPRIVRPEATAKTDSQRVVIPQPVPLGNPPSNSEPARISETPTQPVTMQVAPTPVPTSNVIKP